MTDESWRHGSVSQRHLHLLNSEFMADCTFVVGIRKKKKFQCHKFVLSQSSSVFYAMFNGDLKEKGDVKVEDIEPQHFRKMLEFIYSDNTELENVEKALSVCYAANKYMIDTLTLKCIDFIKVNLDENVVIKALEFARLIDNADLEAESLQYLCTNAADVLKSTSFHNVEKATLLIILGQDYLRITSEVELFSACIRWAEAQQHGVDVTMRDALGPDVLRLIRFLTMTAQEFATIVVPSRLLQLQEEQDILCSLVTRSGNVPRGFNNNTESRLAIGTREIIKINDYYCDRLRGKGINRCPFYLSVNADSYIFGLQLRGLSRHDTSVNPPLQDSFEVKLLLTSSSELVDSVKFEGKMSPGKAVEVNFKNPILLQASVSYTLQVKYSNLYKVYEVSRFNGVSAYNTTARVNMTVSHEYTTISLIYIAKKKSSERGSYLNTLFGCFKSSLRLCIAAYKILSVNK